MCYLGVVALKQALACISCKLRIPCSRTKKANRMKYISDIDVLSFTFRRGLNLIKKVGPFWQMWDLGIHAVEISCPVVSQLCLGVWRNWGLQSITHRTHVCYIHGNIYHQYTPNVSIYTSTMDPSWVMATDCSQLCSESSLSEHCWPESPPPFSCWLVNIFLMVFVERD